MPSGYPSIELGQPGRPACPDNYSHASTVECGGAQKLRIQLGLAAVYIQFGTGVSGIQWGPEEPFLPVVASVVRSFDAVRVRNYTPGVPAQVFLTPVAE